MAKPIKKPSTSKNKAKKSSFAKNFARSFLKAGTKSAMSILAPEFDKMIAANEGLGREIKGSDSKLSLKPSDIKKAIKNNKFVNQNVDWAKKTGKTLLSQIKSGQWFGDPNRTINDELKDAGFDFGDDFLDDASAFEGLDWGDNEDYTEASNDKNGNTYNYTNENKNLFVDERSINNRTINVHNTKNGVNPSLIATMSQSLVGGMGAISGQISQIASFYGNTTQDFYQRSLDFYDSTTDILNNIKENIVEINERTKPKAEENEEYSDFLFDVFGGGTINFKPLVKKFKQKISGVTGDDGVIQFYLESFKQMFADPMKMISQLALEKIIPDFIKETSQSITEKTVEFTKNYLLHLSDIGNGRMSSGNKIIDFVSEKLFGGLFEGDLSGTKIFAKEDYEKGAIPFDGVTKKAITDVIPDYLSRILANTEAIRRTQSYVNGEYINDEEINNNTLSFDYQNNRFIDMNKIKKEMKAVMEDNFSSFADFFSEMTLDNFITTKDGKIKKSNFTGKNEYKNKASYRILSKDKQDRINTLKTDMEKQQKDFEKKAKADQKELQVIDDEIKTLDLSMNKKAVDEYFKVRDCQKELDNINKGKKQLEKLKQKKSVLNNPQKLNEINSQIKRFDNKESEIKRRLRYLNDQSTDEDKAYLKDKNNKDELESLKELKRKDQIFQKANQNIKTGMTKDVLKTQIKQVKDKRFSTQMAMSRKDSELRQTFSANKKKLDDLMTKGDKAFGRDMAILYTTAATMSGKKAPQSINSNDIIRAYARLGNMISVGPESIPLLTNFLQTSGPASKIGTLTLEQLLKENEKQNINPLFREKAQRMTVKELEEIGIDPLDFKDDLTDKEKEDIIKRRENDAIAKGLNESVLNSVKLTRERTSKEKKTKKLETFSEYRKNNGGNLFVSGINYLGHAFKYGINNFDKVLSSFFFGKEEGMKKGFIDTIKEKALQKGSLLNTILPNSLKEKWQKQKEEREKNIERLNEEQVKNQYEQNRFLQNLVEEQNLTDDHLKQILNLGTEDYCFHVSIPTLHKPIANLLKRFGIEVSSKEIEKGTTKELSPREAKEAQRRQAEIDARVGNSEKNKNEHVNVKSFSKGGYWLTGADGKHIKDENGNDIWVEGDPTGFKGFKQRLIDKNPNYTRTRTTDDNIGLILRDIVKGKLSSSGFGQAIRGRFQTENSKLRDIWYGNITATASEEKKMRTKLRNEALQKFGNGKDKESKAKREAYVNAEIENWKETTRQNGAKDNLTKKARTIYEEKFLKGWYDKNKTQLKRIGITGSAGTVAGLMLGNPALGAVIGGLIGTDKFQNVLFRGKNSVLNNFKARFLGKKADNNQAEKEESLLSQFSMTSKAFRDWLMNEDADGKFAKALKDSFGDTAHLFRNKLLGLDKDGKPIDKDKESFLSKVRKGVINFLSKPDKNGRTIIGQITEFAKASIDMLKYTFQKTLDKVTKMASKMFSNLWLFGQKLVTKLIGNTARNSRIVRGLGRLTEKAVRLPGNVMSNITEKFNKKLAKDYNEQTGVDENGNPIYGNRRFMDQSTLNRAVEQDMFNKGIIKAESKKGNWKLSDEFYDSEGNLLERKELEKKLKELNPDYSLGALNQARARMYYENNKFNMTREEAKKYKALMKNGDSGYFDENGQIQLVDKTNPDEWMKTMPTAGESLINNTLDSLSTMVGDAFNRIIYYASKGKDVKYIKNKKAVNNSNSFKTDSNDNGLAPSGPHSAISVSFDDINGDRKKSEKLEDATNLKIASDTSDTVYNMSGKSVKNYFQNLSEEDANLLFGTKDPYINSMRSYAYEMITGKKFKNSMRKYFDMSKVEGMRGFNMSTTYEEILATMKDIMSIRSDKYETNKDGSINKNSLGKVKEDITKARNKRLKKNKGIEGIKDEVKAEPNEEFPDHIEGEENGFFKRNAEKLKLLGKNTAKGAAIGTLLGHPLLGAVAGGVASTKLGQKTVSKVKEKAKEKILNPAKNFIKDKASKPIKNFVTKKLFGYTNAEYDEEYQNFSRQDFLKDKSDEEKDVAIMKHMDRWKKHHKDAQKEKIKTSIKNFFKNPKESIKSLKESAKKKLVGYTTQEYNEELQEFLSNPQISKLSDEEKDLAVMKHMARWKNNKFEETKQGKIVSIKDFLYRGFKPIMPLTDKVKKSLFGYTTQEYNEEADYWQNWLNQNGTMLDDEAKENILIEVMDRWKDYKLEKTKHGKIVKKVKGLFKGVKNKVNKVFKGYTDEEYNQELALTLQDPVLNTLESEDEVKQYIIEHMETWKEIKKRKTFLGKASLKVKSFAKTMLGKAGSIFADKEERQKRQQLVEEANNEGLTGYDKLKYVEDGIRAWKDSTGQKSIVNKVKDKVKSSAKKVVSNVKENLADSKLAKLKDKAEIAAINAGQKVSAKINAMKLAFQTKLEAYKMAREAKRQAMEDAEASGLNKKKSLLEIAGTKARETFKMVKEQGRQLVADMWEKMKNVGGTILHFIGSGLKAIGTALSGITVFGIPIGVPIALAAVGLGIVGIKALIKKLTKKAQAGEPDTDIDAGDSVDSAGGEDGGESESEESEDASVKDDAKGKFTNPAMNDQHQVGDEQGSDYWDGSGWKSMATLSLGQKVGNKIFNGAHLVEAKAQEHEDERKEWFEKIFAGDKMDARKDPFEERDDAEGDEPKGVLESVTSSAKSAKSQAEATAEMKDSMDKMAESNNTFLPVFKQTMADIGTILMGIIDAITGTNFSGMGINGGFTDLTQQQSATKTYNGTAADAASHQGEAYQKWLDDQKTKAEDRNTITTVTRTYNGTAADSARHQGDAYQDWLDKKNGKAPTVNDGAGESSATVKSELSGDSVNGTSGRANEYGGYNGTDNEWYKWATAHEGKMTYTQTGKRTQIEQGYADCSSSASWMSDKFNGSHIAGSNTQSLLWSEKGQDIIVAPNFANNGHWNPDDWRINEKLLRPGDIILYSKKNRDNGRDKDKYVNHAETYIGGGKRASMWGGEGKKGDLHITDLQTNAFRVLKVKRFTGDGKLYKSQDFPTYGTSTNGNNGSTATGAAQTFTGGANNSNIGGGYGTNYNNDQVNSAYARLTGGGYGSSLADGGSSAAASDISMSDLNSGKSVEILEKIYEELLKITDFSKSMDLSNLSKSIDNLGNNIATMSSDGGSSGNNGGSSSDGGSNSGSVGGDSSSSKKKKKKGDAIGDSSTSNNIFASGYLTGSSSEYDTVLSPETIEIAKGI